MGVERKYERDIDVLLAEEFSVEPKFARWFLSRTKFSDEFADVINVHVSKSDNLGESDLIIIYQRDDGTRFALLIEDKVDAPIQPTQALRYRMRADRELKKGTFSTYELILCAPQAYINTCLDTEMFDSTMPYEEIAAFMALDTAPRSQYRADFIFNAASKRTNTWVMEQDDATDVFWREAFEIAQREFSILECNSRKLTKGSNWITIRPRDFPTKPKWTYINIKGDRGFIDLTISNTIAFAFLAKIEHLLLPNMTVHQTKGSASIRIEVPGFRISDGREISIPRIREAFAASKKLIEFYRSNRIEIGEAALASSTE